MIFFQKEINQTYTITSMTFQVSKMGLTTFLTQLVSSLRVTLQKGVIRGKMRFLIFGQFFSKSTFLRLWLFFFASWLSNQLNFSVMVHIYTIRVFDETFFHLIFRMTMITKLFMVVTCCKELSPIYIYMTSQRSGLFGSRDK